MRILGEALIDLSVLFAISLVCLVYIGLVALSQTVFSRLGPGNMHSGILRFKHVGANKIIDSILSEIRECILLDASVLLLSGLLLKKPSGPLHGCGDSIIQLLRLTLPRAKLRRHIF